MKRCTSFLLLLAAITLPAASYAQTKSTATNTTIFKQPINDAIIQERLVALALKGPRYEITEHQNKVDEYELKKAKSSLLNLLTISANYNDQTFAKQNNANAPIVYPKYFYGVNIPLGVLFSHTEVKAAREQVKIGKNTQDLLSRTIRREVLSKYLQYKSANEQILNTSHLIDDDTATAVKIEQQFRDGKITFEQYGLASKATSTDNNLLIQLKLLRDTYKLELEEMIGVPLEDVLSGKIQPEINNNP